MHNSSKFIKTPNYTLKLVILNLVNNLGQAMNFTPLNSHEMEPCFLYKNITLTIFINKNITYYLSKEANLANLPTKHLYLPA